MTDYKLVPVELLKDWHEQINTIAAETAFNVADEMEAILATSPDMQGEPLIWMYSHIDGTEVQTSEERWTGRAWKPYWKETLLYTAPQLAMQVEPVAWGAFYVGGKYNGQLHRHDSSEEEIDRYIAIVHGSNDSLTLRKGCLYTKPVPAEQQSTPDKEKLLTDAEDHLHRLREWKTRKGAES